MWFICKQRQQVRKKSGLLPFFIFLINERAHLQSLPFIFRRDRQHHPEGCAAAFRFIHRDPAAVERSQLFGDGEAETEMAFVRPGGVAPVKAVEDMRPDIGGNPAPLICYGDRHFFPFHRGAYGDLFYWPVYRTRRCPKGW